MCRHWRIGLTDRQHGVTQRSVPFLSSIPWIGGLFGQASRSTAKTELFLFITPHAISTMRGSGGDAAGGGAGEDRHAVATPARRPPAIEGVVRSSARPPASRH